MTRPSNPSSAPVRALSAWKRDLIAAMALSSAVFIGTCVFATVWAATHPELLSA